MGHRQVLSAKILRDPVHNLIAIPVEDRELMLELIDSPEFQRLRRIRQLGLSFLVYPGAEHSRWVHGLGVQHLARQMLDALQARYGAKGEEYQELKKHRRAILVAALLHDLGHGPFSHLFEKVLPPLRIPQRGYPVDHEEWTEQIIRNRFSDYLRRHDVDVDVVAGLINKKNRQNLLAKDFISSQLDADRMDYLLRDSRATGPKYGEFDLPWLLHSLRIGKVHVKGQEDGVWRLCFDSRKAIHVVEEYIQAREFMYVQVYVHKTTRAYEAMLRHVLGLAAMIANGDRQRVPQPCPPALAQMLAGEQVSFDDYLSLDDFRLWSMFADWAGRSPGTDPALKKLQEKCSRLVNRGRPYRTIELRDREQQDKALSLVTSLEKEDSLLRFSCHRDEFADVAYRNVFYRKSSREAAEEDRVIYFVEPGQEPQPAEGVSQGIKAISGIETQVYRLYYDHADEDMMRRLRDDGWKIP